MGKEDVIILGIESSCDDTSAAVLKNETILSNVTASQAIHEEWGGVVPELASRAHQQNIVPVLDAAVKKAGISLEDIDAIAFTRGPGLMGSLIVGTSFSKALSLALDIPLIDVNHMQAHVLAHFIDDPSKEKPNLPFLCLTVSGGHTQLVLVEEPLKMKVIGTTVDDAAGEAFDKTAKLLGLPYPGGPMLDKLAQKGKPEKFSFTKPKIKEFDFSFSGLKTNVLQFLQKQEKTNPNFIEENLNDLCASIQHTIIEVLMEKLVKAAKHHNIQEIAIAGGVSANSGLRAALLEKGKKLNWKVHIPKFEYCTDNAAMIAITGKFLWDKGVFTDQKTSPTARWKLG